MQQLRRKKMFTKNCFREFAAGLNTEKAAYKVAFSVFAQSVVVQLCNYSYSFPVIPYSSSASITFTNEILLIFDNPIPKAFLSFSSTITVAAYNSFFFVANSDKFFISLYSAGSSVGASGAFRKYGTSSLAAKLSPCGNILLE